MIEEGTRGRRSYIPLIRRAPVKDKYILTTCTCIHRNAGSLSYTQIEMFIHKYLEYTFKDKSCLKSEVETAVCNDGMFISIKEGMSKYRKTKKLAELRIEPRTKVFLVRRSILKL